LTSPAVSNVVSGSGGFVINGDKLEDFSGFSVSSAGDVNGDGLSDLIVGTFAAGINGIGTYEGIETPAPQAPTIKSSKPSPLTSPAEETE
jgi:hypothetical protein